MRKSFSIPAAFCGLLLTGAALAGPVVPPPQSCAIDEVRKCFVLGGQTFCRCVKRSIGAGPERQTEPRALKGKPQHMVNQGYFTGQAAPQAD